MNEMKTLFLGVFLLVKSNMQIQQSNSIFKSQDISFCAATLATGKVQLVTSKQISSHRFEFHLQPFDVCRELQSDYINGKLLVSAKAIADNVRLLKSLIKQDSTINNQYEASK